MAVVGLLFLGRCVILESEESDLVERWVMPMMDERRLMLGWWFCWVVLSWG